MILRDAQTLSFHIKNNFLSLPRNIVFLSSVCWTGFTSYLPIPQPKVSLVPLNEELLIWQMGWELIGIDVFSYMEWFIYLSLIHMGVVRMDRFAKAGQVDESYLDKILPHLKLLQIL